MDRSGVLYKGSRLSYSHRVDDLPGYLATLESVTLPLIKTAAEAGIVQIKRNKAECLEYNFIVVTTSDLTEYGYVNGVEEINNDVTRIYYTIDPLYSFDHTILDGMVSRALFPRFDGGGKPIRYLSDGVRGAFSSNADERVLFSPSVLWQIVTLGKNLSNSNPSSDYGINTFCYPVGASGSTIGGSLNYQVGNVVGKGPPIIDMIDWTYFNAESNIVPDDILYGALVATPPVPVTYSGSTGITIPSSAGYMVGWPLIDASGNRTLVSLCKLNYGVSGSISVNPPYTPSDEPMLDYSPNAAYAINDANGIPLAGIPDYAAYDQINLITYADAFAVKTLATSFDPAGGWSAEIQNWALNTIDSDAYLSYLVLQKQSDINALKRADKMDMYQMVSSVA